MAASVMSPRSAISAAAPAVSAWGNFLQAQGARHLAALREGLDVAAHDLDGVERRSRWGQQVMVNALIMLSDDVQAAWGSR